MPHSQLNRNNRTLHAVWLTLAVVVISQPVAQAQSTAPAPGAYGLPECLQLAMQRQPRLAVHRASLAAAEDAARALDQLRMAALVDPEIPVRRRQACIGITAAAAGLQQAERDTAYAVTTAYFAMLYAVEQEALLCNIVDRLGATVDLAQKQLDGGNKDVTKADVNRAKVYLKWASSKRIEATQGKKRALNALREAIGLDCEIQVDESAKLPVYAVRLGLDAVQNYAVTRRGDLIRANLFADVVCLEIEAQNACPGTRKETFAAGNDIHSILVPQGSNYPEIKPGALAPEMPTILVGSRAERVRHAQSLYARAVALGETAKKLIVMEATDSFRRWEETTYQLTELSEAATFAEELANELTAGLRVEEKVSARVLAAQARAQYNEVKYKQLVALADLERVTAGGFTPPWVATPLSAQPAEGVLPVPGKQ
jgi:hypothetical protein